MGSGYFNGIDLEGIDDHLVHIRRHIHSNPEPGTDQPKTVQFLVKEFEGMDVCLMHGKDEVGLVVDIECADRNGPTIGLRADMDALAIHETDDPDHLPNKMGFRSTKEGAMHACGHDAHTAMVFGAGKILYGITDRLKGRVRLLFQPGEEGYHGAERMIEKGYLDDVDNVFALHCYPLLKTGQVGYREGAVFSAIDTFSVKVRGIGGHASSPETCSDQIVAASTIINDLQGIVSRRINPLESAVVSVSHIVAGNKEAFTAIPMEAEFVGSIRTFNKRVQETVREEFFRICEHGAKSVHADCKVEIEYKELYPATINDGNVVRRVTCVLSGLCDEEDLFPEHPPLIASEDFSLMLQEVPGAMLLLGVTSGEKDISNVPYLHSPKFDVDERALIFGAKLLAAIAIDYLGGQGGCI